MKNNWLKECIIKIEHYIRDHTYESDVMRDRERKFLDSLKQFESLPEKQQIKLKPFILQALHRHKKITSSLKVINYYFSQYSYSLNLTTE